MSGDPTRRDSRWRRVWLAGVILLLGGCASTGGDLSSRPFEQIEQTEPCCGGDRSPVPPLVEPDRSSGDEESSVAPVVDPGQHLRDEKTDQTTDADPPTPSMRGLTASELIGWDALAVFVLLGEPSSMWVDDTHEIWRVVRSPREDSCWALMVMVPHAIHGWTVGYAESGIEHPPTSAELCRW